VPLLTMLIIVIALAVVLFWRKRFADS